MHSNLKPLRARELLAPITLVVCVILMLLAYDGEAFAEAANDEGFVKHIFSNVNAYWDEQFQLLGTSYTPAKLAFIYNKPVDTACDLFSTVDGPAYCPANETLYYPVYWRDNGRTLADYGVSAVEWGVAHEVGHHVQMQMDQLGIQRLDTIPLELIELEADCFSGMYVHYAIAQPDDLRAALTAMQDAGGPEHGTSQQRIAAFELGYKTADLSQCIALAT